MTATKTTRPTVEEILADLEAQRNNPELRRQRRLDLEKEIRGYEKRYGMTAAEAHEAIDRRELRETQEVCHWLIAADRLDRTRS